MLRRALNLATPPSRIKIYDLSNEWRGPKWNKMSKSKNDIAKMRESGGIAARILNDIASFVRPGITTKELNDRAAILIEDAGATSAFFGYENFPGVLCASLNATAVHGVPTNVPVKKGDVLGLDFGVVYGGWYSDTAITVGVGNISDTAQRLIEITRQALAQGIKAAHIGNHIGDISHAIQLYVEAARFEVIRELVGHGIGTTLHEPPQVPNFGNPGKGEKLVEGMVLAIEPIVAVSSQHVRLEEDRFGYATRNRSLAAHFEHTVAITEEGPQVLTLP